MIIMMRATALSLVAVAFSCLAACENRPPLGSNPVVQARPADQMGADAAQSPGGGPINGDPKTLAPDAAAAAEAPVVVAGEPAPQVSCVTLAAGGAPDSLDDFTWQRQVRDGPGSDAWDFVWIEKGCVMRHQHENVELTVTMAPADCTAARAWVTNARFLDVVRTGAGCDLSLPGNPDEVFEINLPDEGMIGRKFYRCYDPYLGAVRACLQPLVDRLFPR
jgi:hypothetical protein